MTAAARRHALALSQLRGLIRASGLRHGLRKAADEILSGAITHLMAEAPDDGLPAAVPDPAQHEIGLDEPEWRDPRPHWNRD
jgi:hypothetical protein